MNSLFVLSIGYFIMAGANRIANGSEIIILFWFAMGVLGAVAGGFAGGFAK